MSGGGSDKRSVLGKAETDDRPAARRGRAARRKGSRGESEARKLFSAQGFTAVPWRGGVDGPDFIAVQDGRGRTLSVEVTLDSRRVPNAGTYLNLSKAQKGPGVPVSVAKAERKPWVVQMFLSDFLELFA